MTEQEIYDGVVQGKLWARGGPTLRPAKKLKDHLDLMRLAEEPFAEMVSLLPDSLRAEAAANRVSNRVTSNGDRGDEPPVT